MAKKEEVAKAKEVFASQTPTSYSDIVRTSMRGDRSVMMQFLSDTPEFLMENHRTVINPNLVNKLIDNLCLITDYYPVKMKEVKETKKKTTLRR